MGVTLLTKVQKSVTRLGTTWPYQSMRETHTRADCFPLKPMPTISQSIMMYLALIWAGAWSSSFFQSSCSFIDESLLFVDVISHWFKKWDVGGNTIEKGTWIWWRQWQRGRVWFRWFWVRVRGWGKWQRCQWGNKRKWRESHYDPVKGGSLVMYVASFQTWKSSVQTCETNRVMRRLVFEYLPMPFSLSKRQQKFSAALGTTSARSSISIWSSQSESEAEESDNDVSEQTREDDEHHSFWGVSNGCEWSTCKCLFI